MKISNRIKILWIKYNKFANNRRKLLHSLFILLFLMTALYLNYSEEGMRYNEQMEEWNEIDPYYQDGSLRLANFHLFPIITTLNVVLMILMFIILLDCLNRNNKHNPFKNKGESK